MEAPDGEQLCTCAKSKANWYLEKGLGTLISNEPFTVRLNFEPSNRSTKDSINQYYREVKVNRCAVCGEPENYVRKNIVPREYRRYFPESMKSHSSHDVLLLCSLCHQRSNASDMRMREKLAIECNAPFSTKDGCNRTVDVPQLREFKSISRALLYQRENLPEERLKLLEQKFRSLTQSKVITVDLLKKYVNIDTT